MNKSIINYIKSLRLLTVIFCSLIIFIPVYDHTADLYISIIKALPFGLITFGGMVLNDIYDVEKDKISKPHRPITAGLLPIGKAVILYRACFAAAFAIAFIYFDLLNIIIWGAVLLLIIIYNWMVVKAAVFKTFTTGIINCLCFAFIFINCERPISDYWFLLSLFMFITARELIMDIRDIEGDMKSKVKTLAVLAGKNIAYVLSFVFIVGSIEVQILLLLKSNEPSHLILFAASAVLVLFFFFLSMKKKFISYAINFLWLPMLAAVYIFVF